MKVWSKLKRVKCAMYIIVLYAR